ncbi:hypothetical protein F4778DRAFT_457688 [Xylariomycetidae sp. FL2044]|nr:hypothetical protein F4778DRAFT_457688 [Xylariomycetidae sp. FL2044]
MARLNEPMVSTDSLETLRRKFLRQNRDIARVNSTQALKIRALENECARILSENLDLRGQVIRLETELRESSAQRIADHALEIKEKMEAQLIEWGSMLASLGHEPIPMNRSPRAQKKARLSPGFGRRSQSEWKRRDTISSMKDLEAVAQQEGRLPPLWENKTYPRKSLNQDDTLILDPGAEESADSPDLGPPPVSRFVNEDPVKIDFPTRPSAALPETPFSPEVSTNTNTKGKLEGPVLAEKKVEEGKATSIPNSPEPRPIKAAPAASKPQEPPQIANSSLKRKTREDEKENVPTLKILSSIDTCKSLSDKPAAITGRSVNRPIKGLPSKKDAKEKSNTLSSQRKPLGVKNSNEAVNSPKKTAKPAACTNSTKPRPAAKRDDKIKDHTKAKKETAAPLEIPPEPVSHDSDTAVDIEPEALPTEPILSTPCSPEPPVPREEIKDTPPPVDISSRGETSRGSRRARAAVSYAEPNLRDKMRRPTKQLFDAVSGEGKNMRRTSHSKRDDLQSGPSSAVKSEEKEDSSWKEIPEAQQDDNPALDIMASPLVQKSSRVPPAADNDLPTTVITDRKKQNAAVPSVQNADPEDSSSNSSSGSTKAGKSTAKSTNRRLEEIAAREAEVAKMFDRQDVYEFQSSSPKDDSSKHSGLEETKKSRNASRQSRSRRLSSMAREDLAVEGAQGEKGAARQTGSRRQRASMAATKRTNLDAEGREDSPCTEGDSSLNSTSSGSSPADAPAGRDRASSARRRSMML